MGNDLRLTFDRAPDLYARARPTYPDAVFDRIAESADLSDDSRVLEIGPGTGQATQRLARRGCRIIAVEIGPNLAGRARRELAGFPNVEVVTAAFEDWPLPANPFDLVLAATSWHWLDTATRVAKCAQALRRGGPLATLASHHIAGGTESFFVESQTCYEKWGEGTPPGFHLPLAADIPNDPEDLAPRFAAPTFHRWEEEITYTTAVYLDVLQTYSGHIDLAPPALAGLLDCLGALIDRSYGGRLTKRYLYELRLAQRR